MEKHAPSGNGGDQRFSNRRPSAYPNTSFERKQGGRDLNVRQNSVYGCGDVPGNESPMNNSSRGSKFGKKSTPSSNNQSKAPQKNDDNGKPDKRQKLLDWLKASQAKRDENNRQVFSRWIEKMDNIKSQSREQNAGPTFYCDYLPPPQVMYSAINNYQGEATGTPTVYLGMPPFMYPQHQDLVNSPVVPGTPGPYLNGSEVCPPPEGDFFYQNDPRILSPPCCYPPTFTPKSQCGCETDPKLPTDCLKSAPTTQPTACCPTMMPAPLMNYASPPQVMIPLPYMPYLACDPEAVHSMEPCGDCHEPTLPFADPKLSLGSDQRTGKWSPSDSAFTHPLQTRQSANSLFAQPTYRQGGNIVPQLCDPGVAFAQTSSPLNFNMSQWNALLDDLSSMQGGAPQEGKEINEKPQRDVKIDSTESKDDGRSDFIR